ncbi:MAG TPA: rod-binding protein, partial [Planctomycetota bacterium]|nr:rod-binding protein [Planctomycetota bacterium]
VRIAALGAGADDEAVGEGMFGEGVGNDIQEGLFDSMLSKRLAESGRIGFADHIVRDWEQRGRIAQAPTTADIEASGEATSPVASLGRIKTLGKPTIASIESAVKFRNLPQPKAQAAITDLEVLSHAPHSIP